MPTWEQAQRWADDFERDYPEALPERLQWSVDRLGVQPSRLLRLMGLSLQEADRLARAAPVNWQTAIQRAGEESAWWAETLIGHALSLYHYDWNALRERLRQPPEPDLAVPQPGGTMAPLKRLPPAEREDSLLRLISQNGPLATQALLAYLGQPEAATAHLSPRGPAAPAP